MLIRIQNHTIEDITQSIRFLLARATNDPEFVMFAKKFHNISEVYDWEVSNIIYTDDTKNPNIPVTVPDGDEVELFISPIRMMRDYQNGHLLYGDCDDYAITGTAILREIGYETNVMLLSIEGRGFDHAVIRVKVPGIGDIMVDASAPSICLGSLESNHEELIIE